MIPGEILDVSGEPYIFVEHALYQDAHPNESDPTKGGICPYCVVAVSEKTGEYKVLWLIGGINWALSREGRLPSPPLLETT